MSLQVERFIRDYLPRPQFLFRYDVFLPPGEFGNAELVGNRVIEVNIPMPEFSSEGTPIGNSKWYYSLNNDIGSISMRVLEGEDGETINYFRKWQSRMVTEQGYHRVPLEYKRDVKIQLYSVDGKPTMLLTFKDYFPTRIEFPAISGESSDVLIYTVELSGDSVKISV